MYRTLLQNKKVEKPEVLLVQLLIYVYISNRLQRGEGVRFPDLHHIKREDLCEEILRSKTPLKNLRSVFEKLGSVSSRVQVIFEGKTQLVGCDDTLLLKILTQLEAMQLETKGPEGYAYCLAHLGYYAGEKDTTMSPEVLNCLIELTGQRDITSLYSPYIVNNTLTDVAKILVKKGNYLKMCAGVTHNAEYKKLVEAQLFVNNQVGCTRIQEGRAVDMRAEEAEKGYDLIIASLPYSQSWRRGKNNADVLDDLRYAGPGVLAPASKSDYAYIQHCIYALNNTGKAAVLVFKGGLIRKGIEKKIRKTLIEQGNIEAVVEMPPGSLIERTTPQVLLILRKAGDAQAGIRFIEGRQHLTNKGLATSEQLKGLLTGRCRSRQVSLEELRSKDYSCLVEDYLSIAEMKRQQEYEILEKEEKSLQAKLQRIKERKKDLAKEV